jgi:hypothetical protein
MEKEPERRLQIFFAPTKQREGRAYGEDYSRQKRKAKLSGSTSVCTVSADESLGDGEDEREGVLQCALCSNVSLTREGKSQLGNKSGNQ